MTIEEIIDIQNAWKDLKNKISFTKKDMINSMSPFKDKYGLSDIQILKIARNELSLQEMASIKTIRVDEDYK